MRFIETELQGCWLIEPRTFSDERGYFMESFNKKEFLENTGISVDFVQDNEALSSFGVVRGLHFQTGDFAQAKLVRVLEGTVKDVVVDMRPGSKTFGRSLAIELSQENKLQVFVPKGFAHGYSVLSESALFLYKCDEFYAPHSESGINCCDDALEIDWGISRNEMIISPKDLELPTFQDYLRSQEVNSN